MAEGAPRVRPEHLSHPHMVVGLTLRKEGLEKTLVAEERHAWDVLQAAPSLVEVAQPAA